MAGCTLNNRAAWACVLGPEVTMGTISVCWDAWSFGRPPPIRPRARAAGVPVDRRLRGETASLPRGAGMAPVGRHGRQPVSGLSHVAGTWPVRSGARRSANRVARDIPDDIEVPPPALRRNLLLTAVGG